MSAVGFVSPTCLMKCQLRSQKLLPCEPWKPNSFGNWLINTVNNVDRDHMSSVEVSLTRQLDFLPYDFKGTIIRTNYTKVWYGTYDNFFRAENTANASITIPFRKAKLTWNTNWRPGYRVETLTSSNGFPKWVSESFTHTLDFNWRIRRDTTFFLTARNIFNGIQSGDEYRGRSDLRTRFLQTGAIWTTGVTITFQ